MQILSLISGPDIRTVSQFLRDCLPSRKNGVNSSVRAIESADKRDGPGAIFSGLQRTRLSYSDGLNRLTPRIKLDVIGNEEIKQAVAIVIEKT